VLLRERVYQAVAHKRPWYVRPSRSRFLYIQKDKYNRFIWAQVGEHEIFKIFLKMTLE
jgi:hypothetical protein